MADVEVLRSIVGVAVLESGECRGTLDDGSQLAGLSGVFGIRTAEGFKMTELKFALRPDQVGEAEESRDMLEDYLAEFEPKHTLQMMLMDLANMENSASDEAVRVALASAKNAIRAVASLVAAGL